jgi:hypothetical protein
MANGSCSESKRKASRWTALTPGLQHELPNEFVFLKRSQDPYHYPGEVDLRCHQDYSMCTNISQNLLGGGFLAAFDVRNGIPPQEKLVDGDKVSSDDELDLYKLAVLVSVGIAMLSLCL